MLSLNKSDIPVVILCGGKGTRLREETVLTPKPLVPIGNRPILWHIMKIYSHYGFNNFILLTGYKGEDIRSFFLNYPWINKDFNIKLPERKITQINGDVGEEWNVTIIDTGQESLTGKRLGLVKNILKNHKMFMLTYGDGVSDVNLDSLVDFHIAQSMKGAVMTITGVRSHSKQGKIVHDEGLIHEFVEKPVLNDLINGGFMVMNSEIFNYLSENNTMLEYDLIPKLVSQKKVAMYHHKGFWHAMDTYQDKENLEKIWADNPHWKIWENKA